VTIPTKRPNISLNILTTIRQWPYMVNLQDIGWLPASPAFPFIKGANLPPFAGGNGSWDPQFFAALIVVAHLLNHSQASFRVAVLSVLLAIVAAAAGPHLEVFSAAMALKRHCASCGGKLFD
jgi:hypothetical protein